jgi:hypothetical protein
MLHTDGHDIKIASRTAVKPACTDPFGDKYAEYLLSQSCP